MSHPVDRALAVPVHEAVPGVHLVRLPLHGSPLRHTNGYLLAGDDGWTLVDCGWKLPDVLDALTAQLDELGVRLVDVRRLVVTHHHADHYGLAGTLAELAGLRVMMHRLDWLHVERELVDLAATFERADAWLRLNGAPDELVAGDRTRLADMLRLTSIHRPDDQLEGGEWIAAGRHRFQVVWTPGHTAGHICLFDSERRVLLTGDHVLDPITPNVSMNREDQINPLGSYLESLRIVGGLDADLVLPAHGEPFRGGSRRVAELLAHHDEREAEVLEAVSHGERTAFEVASALPWTRRRRRLVDLASGQQRMALTETIAHLEELRSRELVSSERRAGRLLFSRRMAASV